MAQVMIVDDDRAIREMLRAALEVEGYTVTLLGDGRGVHEALLAMSEPCAVLLDLMMPGMSGWEVCGELARDPRVAHHPVAVMTAGLMAGDPYPAPARALLRKPFELDAIYTLVESLLAATLAAPVAHGGGYGPSTSVA
jgi:CheY-like chemotaxis protein